MKRSLLFLLLFVVLAALVSVWWLRRETTTPPAPAERGAAPVPDAGSAPPVAPAPMPPPASRGAAANHAMVAGQSLRDRFHVRRVVHETDTRDSDGGPRYTRTALVETDFHHPLIRVVEQLERRPGSARDEVVDAVAMVADHVMVKFRAGQTRAQIDEQLRQRGLRWRQSLDGGVVALVGIPADSIDALPAALARLQAATELIELAELDTIVTTMDLPPNDPSFADGTLWAMHNTGQNGGLADQDIDALEAWSTRTDASSVVVAVVDTGVRYTHEDLAANMWRNPGESGDGRETNGIDDDGNGYVDDVFGINVIDGSGDPNDDFGHGTHVAGTIGAVGNNGVGVVGVAWQARIMAVKFLNGRGIGSVSDAIVGLNYARQMGAHVCNNSWGGGGPPSELLRETLAAAGQAGMVIVCAAGNSGQDTTLFPNYPAAFDRPELVSVAAMTREGMLAWFSSFGGVHLAAPGFGIHSTHHVSDSAYATFSGTSMAAPHTAGVVAMLRAHYPADTAAQAVQRLLAGAEDSIRLHLPMLNRRGLNLRRPLEHPDLPRLATVHLSAAIANGAVGESFTFSATVASDSPATYEWLHDHEPVAGATALTLTLDHVQRADSGRYALRVTNAGGVTVSRPVRLFVVGPPLFVTEPADVAEIEGNSAVFAVAALGTGTERINFQWSYNGTPIPGATSPLLTLPGVTTAQSGQYHVTASSIHGSTDSRIATLAVQPAQAPAITQQPTAVSVTADQDATFSVAVTGTPVLSYQWHKADAALTGEVEPTLRIRRAQPDDAGNYHVVVTNSGGAVTSASAALSVAFAPVAPFIVRQPTPRDVQFGERLALSVVAKGAPAPTYQWSHNGAPITGATSASYVVERASTADAGDYVVVATNASGAVASDTVKVTTRLTLTAGGWSWRHPVPQGSELGPVIFAAGRFIAVGRSGAIVTSPDGITWTSRVSGVTTSITGLAAGGGRVVATSASSVLLSEDGGLTWTRLAIAPERPLGAVAYGGGRFMILNGDGTKSVMVTTDGHTWTEKALPDGGPHFMWYSCITYGLGRFWIGMEALAGLGDTGPKVFSSIDGETWTPAAGTSHLWSVHAITAGDGQLAITATETSPGGEWNTGISLFMSADGENWDVRYRAIYPNGLRRTGPGHAIFHVNGHFATLAHTPDGPATFTSTDGVRWTERPLSGNDFAAGLAYGAGTYVVTSGIGQIQTSYDLVRWNLRVPVPLSALFSVAYGPQGFVGAAGATLFRSSQGVLWRQMPSGRTGSASRVVFSHGEYLIMGGRQFSWSADGDTWMTTTLSTSDAHAVFTSVATDGARYIAAGGGPVRPDLTRDGILFTSTDRATWTPVVIPSVGGLRDVMHDGTQFIAVGEQRTVLVSPDGLTWTVTTQGGGNETLSRIAVHGGRYVATAERSRAILHSGDLVTWTSATLPASAELNPGFSDLIFAQGQFFALHSDGEILSSIDGGDWNIAGRQQATAGLCYGHRTLVAVGQGAAILQSDPMVTSARLIVPEPGQQLVPRGHSARIALETLGAGPLAYQWRKNGVDLPGATNAVLELSGVEASDAGEYTAIVNDGGESLVSQPAFVGVIDVAPTISGDAGTGVITITAPAGFPWTIDTSHLWLRVAGSLRGAGSVQRTFVVAANTTGATRTGRLLIGGFPVEISQAPATHPPAPVSRLINLSTRGLVTPGADPMIGGFVISGVAPKRVLIRAPGPELRYYGVERPLGFPSLRLYDDNGALLAENLNWSGGQTNHLEIYRWTSIVGAFPFELGYGGAAIVATLPPGKYTVHVSGPDGVEPGIAMFEIYEAMEEVEALHGRRLVNLSTRGRVEDGEAVLIAGFVIANGAERRVLIRGAGPALTAFNVGGVLEDPQIALYSRDGVVLASNDDWDASATNAVEVTAAGAATFAFPFAAASRDAAMVVTLQPGAYTVQVTGGGSATGTALVEAYEVP